MSSQISNLAFFPLLCTFYNTPYKQVRNCHKPGDLVNQVDCNACIWSDSEDGPTCLRLKMPEFFFESTSCFYIAGTLQSLYLNGSFNRE